MVRNFQNDGTCYQCVKSGCSCGAKDTWVDSNGVIACDCCLDAEQLTADEISQLMTSATVPKINPKKKYSFLSLGSLHSRFDKVPEPNRFLLFFAFVLMPMAFVPVVAEFSIFLALFLIPYVTIIVLTRAWFVTDWTHLNLFNRRVAGTN